jgi:hypothetical protein
VVLHDSCARDDGGLGLAALRGMAHTLTAPSKGDAYAYSVDLRSRYLAEKLGL